MMKWIAIVDDDMTNLKIAGQILNRNNMRVSVMKSGTALLKFMQDNRPDLILLDIAMPEMDGFETLRRLRGQEEMQSRQKTPVIFLTAVQDAETESRGFELGVSDFIRKPFVPEILLKRIENAVEQQAQINRFEADATLDKLTGFLNKAASMEKFAVLCNEKRGSLMMLDLDSFKLVNDLYGHEMGDKVLIAMADCIRSALPNGVHGRVGGDEFLVFAHGMTRDGDAADFAAAVNHSLTARAKELMGEDMEIPLGVSVGIVMTPEQGTDFPQLFKMADKALYHVKQTGKHGYAVFGKYTGLPDKVMGIRTVSMLMDERNIPDCALQLDREHFMYAYRFVMRLLRRTDLTACKILFTVSAGESRTDEIAEEFGEHLMHSLRKSDLMMKVGRDQYFVLLTDVREGSAFTAAERAAREWNTRHTGNTVTFEAELVRNTGSSRENT